MNDSGKTTAFSTADHRQTESVAAKIYSDLQHASSAKQRLFVLVYLPTIEDYRDAGPNRWRRFVQEEAKKNGYLLVDVAEKMRALPPDKVKEFFRKGGHYSAEGNRYVAEVLHNSLSEMSGTLLHKSPVPQGE